MDMQALLTALAGLTASLVTAAGAVQPDLTQPIQPAQAAAVIQSTPSQNLALSLGSLRDSLVNIICIADRDPLHSISGSGVMIDPRGIILTAAHIGQYFLLEERDSNQVTCVIRTGNPARTAYFAKPAYVSTTWITENPDTLTAEAPKGSGENDFALIAITNTATETPLPSVFPYVPLASMEPIAKDQPVAVGAYAAQSLTSEQIKATFYPTLVFGSVMERYTFATSTVDALSLGGSAVAQEGSSGGGATNAQGQLIGVITTSTVAGDLLSRDLHAITVNHIRRAFQAETGQTIDAYLKSESTADLVQDFAHTAEKLSKQLEKDIRRSR